MKKYGIPVVIMIVTLLLGAWLTYSLFYLAIAVLLQLWLWVVLLIAFNLALVKGWWSLITWMDPDETN